MDLFTYFHLKYKIFHPSHFINFLDIQTQNYTTCHIGIFEALQVTPTVFVSLTQNIFKSLFEYTFLFPLFNFYLFYLFLFPFHFSCNEINAENFPFLKPQQILITCNETLSDLFSFPLQYGLNLFTPTLFILIGLTLDRFYMDRVGYMQNFKFF